MTTVELVINDNYAVKGVRWKVGTRTLDEVVATYLDLPSDRLATTNMLHSWRQIWRAKNPSSTHRNPKIALAQTVADLKAGEQVGAFKRSMEGKSEVWTLIPSVLGLKPEAPVLSQVVAESDDEDDDEDELDDDEAEEEEAALPEPVEAE